LGFDVCCNQVVAVILDSAIDDGVFVVVANACVTILVAVDVDNENKIIIVPTNDNDDM
jgi:hypothetical protein